MEANLPLVWLVLIGFFLLYYAVADGFDLGVGIISLFAGTDERRGLLMSSLEGIWHDNQTWLVLLGGMMFGAFPLFYSLVLSSLYIPILVMLFGLVFRGVSFEFRESSTGHKRFWGIAFGVGSLLVTLSQGFALGGLLGGLQIEEGRYAGGVWGWLHWHSALIASGVLCGYVMLGANFLILKTEKDVQDRSYRYAWRASICTLAIACGVHAWNMRAHPYLARKLLTFPENVPILLLLGLAAVCFVMYFRSLSKRYEKSPLIWNIGIILFSFAGLSAGMYPYMIPNIISSPITVHAAAASPQTLRFMLVVTGILLPVILVYTVYKHTIFKGKVREAEYGG
ncbi:MAG: cytochrome d ubiquinol oxidase subunit II [Desulfobacteraceae bacterium]|nr:cytochrome d ubiquinol oxidase subunit II [Desulfobacteraceae bacterium]